MDFGWRVHEALQAWTDAVDQKASIILVFAVALATLAAHEVFDDAGGLHAADGAALWTVRAMGIAFAAAALLAVSVVLPRLRRRRVAAEAANGLVYFGHLRHRTPHDIHAALALLDDDAILAQLSRQMHVTSAIAWRKHVCLQAAIVALILACALFASARLVLV